ncbi:50S ribosomal protein L13 [Bdellovibrionota bacterium]
MPTFHAKAGEVEKNWHLIDATDQVVGRLATQIATLLRGKHRPQFSPHLDCGDFVIVTNAEKVKFTGKKFSDKCYHSHSGYIGGLRTRTAGDLLEKNPEQIIKAAVKGMMPKNKLARQLLTNLKVYRGSEHPHAAQQPKPFQTKERG